MTQREYIVTKHIEIMKAKDNESFYYKLFIYDKPVKFGPYELKGDLMYSPSGVKELTKEFIEEKIGSVYTNFPDNEVDELITKLNNKKWLKQK
tara:strand:- start:81 stop:359 length:279 start_codon:yes stop_codon:yes gene_type:complete